MKKKEVSIYCKGYRQSVAYYRNYQYFDHIEEIIPQYRVMMSEKFELKYMPISKQTFFIKMLAYFHTLRRVTCQLMKDYFNPPDVLVVHRRFITKVMPLPLKWLVLGIYKKGVPIFWDIDDNIKGRELTNREYKLLSEISTGITVTHEFLRDTIDEKYRDKVTILHTTDGDLYKQFNTKLNDVRLNSLNKEVRMVWVATNVNLPYLVPMFVIEK